MCSEEALQRVLPKAWHLAELGLLFLTQAALEMDSRGMLALLLLSLCLGQEVPEMGPLTGVLGLGLEPRAHWLGFGHLTWTAGCRWRATA